MRRNQNAIMNFNFSDMNDVRKLTLEYFSIDNQHVTFKEMTYPKRIVQESFSKETYINLDIIKNSFEEKIEEIKNIFIKRQFYCHIQKIKNIMTSQNIHRTKITLLYTSQSEQKSYAYNIITDKLVFVVRKA